MNSNNPNWKQYPADQKVMPTLGLEGGGLSIFGQGYGGRGGSGYFTFDDDDLQHEFHHEDGKSIRLVNLSRSELIAIHDYIRENVLFASPPPADDAGVAARSELSKVAKALAFVPPYHASLDKRVEQLISTNEQLVNERARLEKELRSVQNQYDELRALLAKDQTP